MKSLRRIVLPSGLALFVIWPSSGLMQKEAMPALDITNPVRDR
jgi:hypothetical protein